MLVQQILASKGDAGVITVAPGSTVQEVAELLSSKRIGAVIVSADGKAAKGIVSERDIVRELGRRGASVLDQPISDLMTRKLLTCTTGEDALEILERMTTGRFRHLPVVDDAGQMIGFVSIGDAVSARLKELHAEKEALTGMIMGN